MNCSELQQSRIGKAARVLGLLVACWILPSCSKPEEPKALCAEKSTALALATARLDIATKSGAPSEELSAHRNNHETASKEAAQSCAGEGQPIPWGRTGEFQERTAPFSSLPSAINPGVPPLLSRACPMAGTILSLPSGRKETFLGTNDAEPDLCISTVEGVGLVRRWHGIWDAASPAAPDMRDAIRKVLAGPVGAMASFEDPIGGPGKWREIFSLSETSHFKLAPSETERWFGLWTMRDRFRPALIVLRVRQGHDGTRSHEERSQYAIDRETGAVIGVKTLRWTDGIQTGIDEYRVATIATPK